MISSKLKLCQVLQLLPPKVIVVSKANPMKAVVGTVYRLRPYYDKNLYRYVLSDNLYSNFLLGDDLLLFLEELLSYLENGTFEIIPL